MSSRGANKLIKLGWIGAGGINFGSLEGPWNHAVRMQKQTDVQFTAVVDPDVSAAQVWGYPLYIRHAQLGKSAGLSLWREAT